MTRIRSPRVRFDESFPRLSDDECWPWMKSLNSDGYGHFYMGSDARISLEKAHRASWMFHVGEIPCGAQVLHRCDNPRCVNPAHLFLGTHVDNMRDMAAKKRHRLQGDLCLRGHPLFGDNLYLAPKNGMRQCRACKRDRQVKMLDYRREHNEMVAQYGFGGRL
jgi:HNH endonuclease